ncbi:hypothetical protein CN378_12660 [Bacillus sp. AFS015802]|uniref:replication-relaxation family protein n=1 Tax=Bacillus sp. AFS015802 TaxID=2033486 RepID=UPI000BF29758|nr:replication-relaxation family protein [Bacillus sp. AFS015802]PFA66860.1 hypothetical protein CN378_12660 [Bacillus sp. AFS015802]
MRKRDLAILKDLERFRCMTRDDIINLHFAGLKNPVTCANTVLKRLRRDCHIEVNTDFQPYIYFLSPSPIKKDSAKIPHFLKIVEFYGDLLKHQAPHTFIVEPKYGKGYMEPDIFMIWKRAPFFVEIQRSVYSHKIMSEKLDRYEAYRLSKEWENEPWQPTENKVFPKVILITDTRYNIDSPFVKFIQVQNINQLVAMSIEKPKPVKSSGIQIKIS